MTQPAYNSTTSLSAIRNGELGAPCQDGWSKLLKHLGKTKADNEALPLLTVLESNGLDDALWVLSADPALDRLARHFQAWCADQVLHIYEAAYPDDSRVRDQIAMLRNDDATDEDRAATRAAAWDAAEDAEWSASRVAAWVAAWASARAAAEDAVWATAWSATRASVRGSVRDSVLAAERDAQEKQLRKMIEATK